MPSVTEIYNVTPPPLQETKATAILRNNNGRNRINFATIAVWKAIAVGTLSFNKYCPLHCRFLCDQ